MACRRAPSRSAYCSKAGGGGKKRRPKKRPRSCKPGKITRNPFFNYLRWFRKKHCGMNMVQIAVEGAKCWCKMSDEQRKKFYKEACGAPPMRRRAKGRSRSRRRGGGGGLCGGGRARSRRRRGSSRGRGRGRTRGRGKGKSRGGRKKTGCSACSRPRRAQSTC